DARPLYSTADASFPAGNSGGKPRSRGAFFSSDGAVGSFKDFPQLLFPEFSLQKSAGISCPGSFSGTRPDPRGIRLCFLSFLPGSPAAVHMHMIPDLIPGHQRPGPVGTEDGGRGVVQIPIRIVAYGLYDFLRIAAGLISPKGAGETPLSSGILP